ncbi:MULTISPECIES: hypothetical protein [Streptomyces]|uniref:Conjugal transfer protein TrbC n=1 Tax=Streptomyces niveus TaxID=193462 RepID=A0ABZ2A8B1_STRNV|nr:MULTISPECIES: hypothetical protein [Streptomyces]EST26872.1 hypothetical protein M877_18845 [Streptomyces niveus NCIMB 11891]WTA60645.1 hypothetical protein OG211_20290 [Streptomyces niveus]
MSTLLASVLDASTQLTHTLAAPVPPSGVPDVGGGEAPPGAEDLLKILRWVAWTVTILCVAGIFGVAARMAVDHSRGGGRDHARGLGFVLGACLLLGSASGIVGAFV